MYSHAHGYIYTKAVTVKDQEGITYSVHRFALNLNLIIIHKIDFPIN